MLCSLKRYWFHWWESKEGWTLAGRGETISFSLTITNKEDGLGYDGSDWAGVAEIRDGYKESPDQQWPPSQMIPTQSTLGTSDIVVLTNWPSLLPTFTYNIETLRNGLVVIIQDEKINYFLVNYICFTKIRLEWFLFLSVISSKV